MVNGKGRRKDVAGVAIFTNVGRLDMSGMLAGCLCSIVTVEAAAGDIDMVEVSRQPANGGVAVVTIVPACYVRGMFARRGYAVMA